MILHIGADERSGLFNTNRSSLLDVCIWYSVSTFTNENTGEDIKEYTYRDELPCGFSYSSNQVSYNFGSGVQNIIIDGVLRIAYEYVSGTDYPKPQDKIAIIKKLGQTLFNPIEYEIINVSIGHGILICQLKAIIA